MTVKEMFDAVCDYFDGDIHKTNLWFNVVNPNLGNVTPREMIALGRADKLSKFISESLDDNRLA